MSKDRFSKLEFEPTRGKRPAAPSEGGGAVSDAVSDHFVREEKDERYYLKRAWTMELAGDPDQALRAYSAALGERPLLLAGWLGQLRMLIELNEYHEARLWADKAMEYFPDHANVLALKALALFRMGNRQEAWKMNDAALEKNGESFVIWLCRGEMMHAESKPAADHCFRRAVALCDNKGWMRMQIGSVLLAHEDYREALSYLKQACDELPRSALAWNLMGCAQAKLGFTDQAGRSFATARELAPWNERLKNAASRAETSGRGSIGAFFRKLFGK